MDRIKVIFKLLGILPIDINHTEIGRNASVLTIKKDQLDKTLEKLKEVSTLISSVSKHLEKLIIAENKWSLELK